MGIALKIGTFAAMTAVIILAFVLPAPQAKIGEASRIFFFHVPAAIVASLAFLMAMAYSIGYLKSRSLQSDLKAATAAEMGLLFSIVATVSGAIFAKVTWGTYWNWDPRETSMFVLILIYGAYLTLRSAIDLPERRAALSAVYAILAVAPAMFLIFVVPRVYKSLHPTDTIVNVKGESGMSPEVRAVFFLSIATFILLYFWVFGLSARIKMRTLGSEAAG
jgi:heme exporter protein C